MLKVYNLSNTIIPHHKTIFTNYKKILNEISPNIQEFAPIISGSYCISKLFKPSAPYNDCDIYFTSEESYDAALKEVEKKQVINYKSSNSVSFTTESNKKLQLIRKFFLPPEKLIYLHDFTNCSIAFQSDTIYTTGETIDLFYKK